MIGFHNSKIEDIKLYKKKMEALKMIATICKKSG
jgi:hypothetical protein